MNHVTFGMVNLVTHEVGMIEEYLQQIKFIFARHQLPQAFMSSQQNRFHFPFASGPSQTIASISPVPVMRFRPPTRRYFLRSDAAKLAGSREESITRPNEQVLCQDASANFCSLTESASSVMKCQTDVQSVSANRTFGPESRSQTWPNFDFVNQGATSGVVRSDVVSNTSIKFHYQRNPCVTNCGIQNNESGQQSFSRLSTKDEDCVETSIRQHHLYPSSMTWNRPNQSHPIHSNSTQQSMDANVFSRSSSETQDSHRTFFSRFTSNVSQPSDVSSTSTDNANLTPHSTGIDQKASIVSARSTPVTSNSNLGAVTGRPTTLMNLTSKAAPTAGIHTQSSCHASRTRSRSAERQLRSPLRPPSTSPSRPPFPVIPSFFGWFLDPGDAIDLVNRAHQIVKQLCEDSDISKWLGWSLEDSVWIKTYSHCTSMYCGYGKKEGAAEYTTQAWSKLGCRTKLIIDAIFVTSRSIGARVCLNKYQRSWWAGQKESIPTAPHITLAVRKGIAPVICGRDLASMMQNVSSQETKSGVSVWVDSRGEGCLIDVKGIILPTTFRNFPS